MLRRLYDWTLETADHRHAERWLAFVSFIESSIFPVPPDIMIVPMVLAEREKAWRIALIATIASVLGGLAGYAIGALFFDLIGNPIIAFYGFDEKFEDFAGRYNEWGAWIVFGAGVTPFPYKVITIASGVTQLDLLVFTVASVLARGLRFFIVAGLLWYFGPPIRRILEAHLGKLTILFFLLLVGGFALIKFVI